MEIRLDDYCNHWIEWVRCPFAIWYGYISSSNMICKYTQHHTYKARCLPQEIDISEVLRLPQKMTVILRKSFKSISPVTQKDFRHMSSTRGNVAKCHTRRTKKHINVTEQLSCENRSKVLRLSHKAIFDTLSHTSECHQAQRLWQNYTCHVLQNLQKSQLSQVRDRHDHIFPIADSRRRLPTASNVERTHLHPKSPKDKREPFALHSGIIYIYIHINLDHPN